MNLRLILINGAFLITVPGVVGGVIPYLSVTLADGSLQLSLGPLRYVGMVVMFIAGAVYLRCAVELASRGHGVPAPVQPTQFVVRSGLYRYVRNPMYVTGSLFVYAQGIAFEQGAILIWGLLLSTLQHLGVVFLEEPALRARFGDNFQRYCGEVPRWLPRLTPAPADEPSESP